MNHKEILELVKEMKHSDLTKLEIKQADFKILISKETVNQERPATSYSVPSGSYTGQQVVTEVQAQSIGQVQAQNIVVEQGDTLLTEAINTELIKSPMVGTYYEKPAPDQPSFVKVGDRVKKGQVVCIIEAMKLMNEIESEYDGIITEVLVGNEQMVEFGQPLYRLEVK